MKDMFQELIKSQMQQQALQQAEEREARTQQMQMAQDELEKRRAQIGKVREAQQFLINRPQPMGLMNPLLEMADLATGGQTQYADQYRKSGRAQATPEERMKEALMTETGLANLEAQLPVPKFAAGSRAAGGVGMTELLALIRMEQQNKQWERSEARRWSGLEQQKDQFNKNRDRQFAKDYFEKGRKFKNSYREIKGKFSALNSMFAEGRDEVHVQELLQASSLMAKTIAREVGVLTENDIQRARIETIQQSIAKLQAKAKLFKGGQYIPVDSLESEYNSITRAYTVLMEDMDKTSRGYKGQIEEIGRELGVSSKLIDASTKSYQSVSDEVEKSPEVKTRKTLNKLAAHPLSDKLTIKGSKVTIREFISRNSVKLRDPEKAQKFYDKVWPILEKAIKEQGR